jgi:hypothetical protein
MTKLNKNPINAVLKQKSTQEKIVKAKYRFRFKPFFEKYTGVNVSAKILIWLLPLVSITTGLVFLGAMLQNIVPNLYLSYIFAGTLIALLEYAKSYLLGISFTDFYAGLKSYGALAVALLLTCISAYTSLQGVKEIHKQMDKSLIHLEDNQVSQADSLRTYFDKQLSSTKNDLAGFKASITWKGKIDMYNKANANTIQDYSQQITQLQQDKAKTLTELTRLHQKQTSATEQATGFNLVVVICIIAIIEILILIANWFVVFYDYMTAKQAEVLQGSKNSIYLDIDSLQESFLSFMQATGLNANMTNPSSPSSPPISPKPFSIGFQRNDTSINTDTLHHTENQQDTGIDIGIDTGINTASKMVFKPKISTKDRLFLKAYSSVVDDLHEGKSYGQILKTDYLVIDLRTKKQVKKRISKTTLQNINRVLQNL